MWVPECEGCLQQGRSRGTKDAGYEESKARVAGAIVEGIPNGNGETTAGAEDSPHLRCSGFLVVEKHQIELTDRCIKALGIERKRLGGARSQLA